MNLKLNPYGIPKGYRKQRVGEHLPEGTEYVYIGERGTMFKDNILGANYRVKSWSPVRYVKK